MKSLLLFLMVISECSQTIKGKLIDSKNDVCDIADFDRRRKNTAWKATEEYLEELNIACSKKGLNATCKNFPSILPSWSFRMNTKTKKEYLQFNFNSVNNTGGCWMFALVEKSKLPNPTDSEEKEPSIEIKFYEIKNNNMTIQVSYHAAHNYTFRIIPLPTGKAVELKNWIAPDLCQNEVIYDVQSNMKREGTYELCKNRLNYGNLLTKATELCENFTDKDVRRSFVSNNVKVINCTIKYIKQQKTKKSNSVTVTIISGTVVPLGFIAIIIYIIYKRRQKRHFTADSEFDEHNRNQNGASSVMVVHRPGCDHLDKLVYQFSSFLMSYNLDVKVTFNDEDLSIHGGIASYLHQNIEMCDYVIIFITEKSGKNPLLKHRPYEFSLKLMEGLALHETSKARFIPVYITNYKQAVTMFPPFLKATSGYGYCIPQQNRELIHKLLKIKRGQSKKPEDRNVKDKMFRCEMKETIRQFSSFLHRECNKEHCKKGVKHGSHTNLSSIWATTVNTKWKSTESLDEKSMTKDQEEEENEMKEIQFHKTLNFVQNLTDSNSEIGQYDILTSDNPDNYLTVDCFNDVGFVHYSSQSSDEVICDMDKEQLLKVKNI